MASISSKKRKLVHLRARGLCEYCQTAKVIVVTVEVDHIHPLALGGSDELTNLCLSCRTCNNCKRDRIVGLDPQTGLETPLFNPRTQMWHEHFRWSEDNIVLIGLTAIGRATIEQLQINRAETLVSRQVWVRAGWHPPKL